MPIESENFMGWLVVAFLAGMFTMTIFALAYVKPNEYKQALLDVANGKPKYEMVIEPDTTWQRSLSKEPTDERR